MTDRLTLRLGEPTQAWAAIQQAWRYAKGWLVSGGGGLVLTIKPETRSDKQNRLLHAMLGDISKQCEWAGRRRDIETWKRLMTAAWLRARGEQVELLPALDGHGVDIVFRRTSQLTRAECCELCDFVAAWCAEHDVVLRYARQWVDPETGEIAGAA